MQKEKLQAADCMPVQHDYWLDNIKGILMILVVIGHMTAQLARYSTFINNLYVLITSFHMGSFLILSGYMSKRRIDQKDYISVINKNILPYLAAQLLLYFTAVILPEGLKAANSTYFDRSSFSFFIPIYQLWYLMAIIIAMIISIKLQPKRHPLLYMGIAVAVSLSCGYLVQVNILRLTKCLSFYPFFLLGYLLPSSFFKKLREKWYALACGVIIFGGYCYFMAHGQWAAGLNKIYGFSQPYAKCDPQFLGLPPVLGRLVFLITVPLIAFAFYTLCPRKKCLFSKLGQNSLFIFVLHSLIVVPIRCLHYDYKIFSYFTTRWTKLGYLLFCVAVTFILGSNTIKKWFSPILAANADIRKIIRYLAGSK